MKQIIIISIMLSANIGYGQMVKFIKNPLQAKYRVYITKNPSEANQWIFSVPGPTDIRKPGEWYIVKNPQLFKNVMTLYQVKKSDEADLIIYYVSTRDSARIF